MWWKKVVILIIVVLLGVALWFLYPRAHYIKHTQYSVGNYAVLVDTQEKSTQDADTVQLCRYTVQYQGKTIELGTYKEQGTCEMTQAPTLSNGILAVITQAYVFLYDPKTGDILKLDPFALNGFSQFATEKSINIYTDFPQKRFIVSGQTLQVLYQRNAGDTKTPQRLMFTSNDSGKSFVFDPTQQ